MDQRLFKSILNSPIDREFLVLDYNNDYSLGKPQVDFDIKADIDWDKKCASLSIKFKLSII